jgi:transcriptional regulator with XRE-family HTH domain
MLYWLGKTLRQEREAKNLKLADVYAMLRTQGETTAESTLSRLENGHTWSRETEKIITVYAFMCGIDDARDLWAKALRQWLQHGGVPVLGELTPQMRAYLLAVEADRRTRPADAESPSETNANVKRREAR